MRRLCVVLLGLWLAPCASAGTVYKCFDATGRVVYQAQTCASSKLKDGGEIEPAAVVPPEEIERIKAEQEKKRARREALKKAEEESQEKARQQEQEERKIQALERQAQAAEEQARAAEREARAAEESARTPKIIVVPVPTARHPPAHRPPYPPSPCAPGDRRCR